MPKQVNIRMTSAGLDTGPFNITNDAGENIATGVSKVTLFNGVTYSMSDNASTVILTSTGTCTNTKSKVIVQVLPTPTPTPTATVTPTPTATATPTPSVTTPALPTITLSWINQAKMFGISLSQALGFDISVESIYVDGYNNTLCQSAVASAADVRNILALPAGNTNYSWSPQTICGSNTSSACWTGVVRYTMYNIRINGNIVSNGDVITISGTQIKVNFPPCRTA